MAQVARCFFCGQATDEDNYCEGCTTFVCDSCNDGRKPIPKGSHDVHRHIKARRKEVTN